VHITDIVPTTVTVPLQAPIRHSNGVHWGRFVRTVVEVKTDEGLSGWGEMGGGGESAEAAFRSLKTYLLGHDPLHFEALRWKISNPTASLYNNRTQLHAAIEFACLDLAGKKLGLSAGDLLGGRLRDRVPFAAYLFFRYPHGSVIGEETPGEMVAQARDLISRCGFGAIKMKCGVFPPDHDIECYRALAAAFPNHGLRLDPNCAWSVEEAVRVGRAIEHLRNDYFEDPTYGLEGMRRVRHFVRIPTATNTVVVNFEQLAACIRTSAVDVILLDTTFWGGLRQCWKAAQVCETFQWGVSVHSSGELGIQLATMLHLGSVLPNLRFAADAHYHHLTDDILAGGKLPYRDGAIDVPAGPGLGIDVDRDRLARYAELYKELGPYPYDRDPRRPAWFSIQPENRFATPTR